MGNNVLVNRVLKASIGRAPDMTHALCSLGNGDMGAGIRSLLYTGQRAGIIKGVSITALITFFGIGIKHLCLYTHHENKSEEITLEAGNDYIKFTVSVYENERRNVPAFKKQRIIYIQSKELHLQIED